MHLISFSVLFITALAFSATAWEVKGKAELELRYFFEESSLANQRDGSGPSILFEPEFTKALDNGDELTLTPLLRLDSQDDRRTHVDLKEAYWLRSGDNWELQIGNAVVFWGVTESQHLVDIINTINFVESPDGEDKLGQPMIQYGKFTPYGDFSFYWLPVHRQQTFPGVEGRLRAEDPVDVDHVEYSNGGGRWRQSFATRWKNYYGPLDVGISHFHGVDRTPRLVSKNNVLTPTYDVIDQTSIDTQYTHDAWLWKFEGITRSGQGERFNAMVGGFEYTVFGFADTSQDLGLLAEYHRDDRGVDAPTQNFQDDIFLGARWVANNVKDTEILAGVAFDRLTKARTYSIEADHRLNDRWDFQVEGHIFAGQDNSVSTLQSREDYVLIKLGRYF